MKKSAWRMFLALILFIASGTQAAEITVAAASSLTDAMNQIASRFEHHFPEHKIHLTFAASGSLLQQIRHGAPIDIFVSADQETMDKAQALGLIDSESRSNFVQNTLVVITSITRTLAIESLTQLKSDQFSRIAIGAPASVPVGRYTQARLEQEGLWENIKEKVVYAQNVRQVLDYVARDEVDLGFVYATDAVILADKVKVLFEITTRHPILYPIAAIQGSAEKQLVTEFLAYIEGAESQNILNRFGFGKP